MKKIISSIFIIFALVSCGKDDIKETSKIINEPKIEIPKEKQYLFFNPIIQENTGNDITLKGSLKQDLDKIEIYHKNSDKESSYFLQKFKKGDKEFLSNLKISYGNIGVGKNDYIIKGYLQDKIVEEINYSIDYNCKITFETFSGSTFNFDFGQDKKCNNGNNYLKSVNVGFGKGENPFSEIKTENITLDNYNFDIKQNEKIIYEGYENYNLVTIDYITGSLDLGKGINVDFTLRGEYNDEKMNDNSSYIYTKENVKTKPTSFYIYGNIGDKEIGTQRFPEKSTLITFGIYLNTSDENLAKTRYNEVYELIKNKLTVNQKPFGYDFEYEDKDRIIRNYEFYKENIYLKYIDDDNFKKLKKVGNLSYGDFENIFAFCTLNDPNDGCKAYQEDDNFITWGNTYYSRYDGTINVKFSLKTNKSTGETTVVSVEGIGI